MTQIREACLYYAGIDTKKKKKKLTRSYAEQGGHRTLNQKEKMQEKGKKELYSLSDRQIPIP